MTKKLIVAALVMMPVLAFARTDFISPWIAKESAVDHNQYACPSVAQVSEDLDVDGIYSQTQKNVIDPKRMQNYQEKVAPLRDAAWKIIAAADAYQNSGDSSSAICAQEILAELARDNALLGKMSNYQASFTQGWMLSSFGVSFLKIVNDKQIDKNKNKLISEWLKNIALQNKKFFLDRQIKNFPDGNTKYWGALGTMAAGIAANDDELYSWGVNVFKGAMAQVTPDGFLPIELKRDDRALGYHVFAMEPLSVIAQLAFFNGDDVYDVNNNALKRLMNNIINGMNNPGIFESKTGFSQTKVDYYFGWLRPLLLRWPNSDGDLLVKKYTQKNVNYLYLGGMPLLR